MFKRWFSLLNSALPPHPPPPKTVYPSLTNNDFSHARRIRDVQLIKCFEMDPFGNLIGPNSSKKGGKTCPPKSSSLLSNSDTNTTIIHSGTTIDTLNSQNIRFISKGKLCSQFGLLPRDIREIDGTLKQQLPTILVRSQSILVNLEPLRCIIKGDGAIFILNDEDEAPLKASISSLQNKIHSLTTQTLPFELRVLELILEESLNSLQMTYDQIAPEIEKHILVLERGVHWENLKLLLRARKRAEFFQERINNVRDCLKELLSCDNDMAAMYLSERSSLLDRRPSDKHEEVELLLETFLREAEELASRTQLLLGSIHSTEDIVNIGLVGQRNDLLLLDLRLSIGTFAASMGGFGASLLGMNVRNFFETGGLCMESLPFISVSVSMILIASVAFWRGWRHLKRLVSRSI